MFISIVLSSQINTSVLR